MEKIIINIESTPLSRTDQFISESIKDSHPELTRSKLKNLLNSECIFLNEKLLTKLNQKLSAGDIITIEIPPLKNTDITPQNIPLDVIYDDEDIIIINKQKGLQSHPGGGNYNDTLVNALLYHYEGKLSGIGGVIRPGIVHRLDRKTTGLMVVAKNDLAHLHISAQLKDRSLKRTYLALAFGIPHTRVGTIETLVKKHPIKRHLMRVDQHDGKHAITKYSTKEEFFDKISLIECNLKTGRTHQIRIHLSHIGHSVVGDQDYGHNTNKIKHLKHDELREKLQIIDGQLLHAYKLELIHPRTKKIVSFEAKLPDEFADALELLRNIEQ
ncbi:MAG: RluA family pseudouridine synthase [Rickettsiales bacterium]|jgi:23S rRNA pseudouridine1911/1915/1917 synthase|nr:RluA family pseudouridine synthase [Rickettsiales bacterium]